MNASIVEVDRIAGIQNPLFGIVSYKYLRGLGLDEVRRMLRTLGRRMGLKFSESAVEYTYRRYGGHPLLTRLACSLLHQRLAALQVTRPVEIDETLLKRDEAARDAELTFYCRHVVSELRDFYPDEYEMLELLAIGRVHDFIELQIHPEYVHHLEEYGLLSQDSLSNQPQISIPVVGRYVALEEARRTGRKTLRYLVPEEGREVWLKGRIHAIINDLTELQRLADQRPLPSLFGPNSFPEGHRFAALSVVSKEGDFETFINCCNRCFVESIEVYGQHSKKEQYFWKEVKHEYPDLWNALYRIKLYRHNRMHIRLRPVVDKALQEFLDLDLEGRAPHQVEDLWFVLQQSVLNALLAGLQIEISRLGK